MWRLGVPHPLRSSAKGGKNDSSRVKVKQGEGWLKWSDLLFISQTKEMQDFLLTYGKDSDIWSKLTRQR